MESLEITAKTVEEAIQQALEQLGVSREEVEVSVVKEGKSGILGLGSDEAVVIVTPITVEVDGNSDITESPEKVIVNNGNTADVARNALEKLLGLMDVNGSITVLDEPIIPEDQAASDEEETGPPIVFNIDGEDLGILIGRRGQTLSCLQYIVRLIVGHETRQWLPITIDVESYKKRRYEQLHSFARQMAEQVEANEKSFTLEPMSAYERRIVHIALADNPGVVTESIGQGESRRVVILPSEYSE
ncbi:RNA-binding cell elongation regulator Jag/EloR [Chloroflexota bacterium]